jgi:hypothetical protein
MERVGLDCHVRGNRSPAVPPRIRAVSRSGTTSEYPPFVRHNSSKPPAADWEQCDENKLPARTSGVQCVRPQVASALGTS